MLITPAYAQFSLHVLVKTGAPRTSTVGDPGAHGPGIVGTHGMGVNTPKAAVVAVETVGLARDVHIKNGGTFTIGALSMMFAVGGPSLSTVGLRTTSDEGAVPKLHCKVAPIDTI